MKRWIAMLMMVPGLCFGAAETFYQTVYFTTNVFLADSTNVPLHQRIPTGAVSFVSGGKFSPSGPIEFDGAVTIAGPVSVETNGMQFTFKPDVSGLGTGVIINANGEIVLNRFVTGVGWTNITINPTNPFPTSLLPLDARYSLISTGPLLTGMTYIAIGASAFAGTEDYGIAIGNGVNGARSGLAVGYNANGNGSGVSLSQNSSATNFGVGVGYSANGSDFGVAVGPYSIGRNGNVSVGYRAQCAAGTDRISIGHDVVNSNDNSAVFRGTVYLDGGTNVIRFRTAFGSGGWTEGRLLVVTNSFTGGVMRLSTDNGNTWKLE